MNRQVIIQDLPKGELTTVHFNVQDGPVPEPAEGQVLVRTILISIDAANRAWMQGATYREAVKAGDVMHGYVIGQVIRSADPAFSEGDLVGGEGRWAEQVLCKGRLLEKLPDHRPLSHLISLLGIAGKTAYHGLVNVGLPKPGETVVVSAAAGSVGIFVGQIAKALGCRAVGIAGGAEKCAWLTEELGFDAAIDYRGGNLFRELRAACPDGIDVYFDNVGGDHLTAAIEVARPMARFAECGMIAQYNETGQPTGPHNVIQIVGKQLKIQGFIVSTHADMQPDFFQDMAKWIPSGQMKYEETVKEGIEKAPEAFIGLFEGANTGKMLVKLG